MVSKRRHPSNARKKENATTPTTLTFFFLSSSHPLLSLSSKKKKVLSQLDQCRAFPDFNNYLAFIFSRGGGEASGGQQQQQQPLDLRLAAGLLLKNNLRSCSSSPPSPSPSPSSPGTRQQHGSINGYVRATLLELLFPTSAPAPFAAPPPPLPRALRSAAAAAAAAIVGSSSAPSSSDRVFYGESGGEAGGLGDWPELLEAMVSALEGRGGGGSGNNNAAAVAAVAALEALVAIAEDSPLALSAPLPPCVAASLAVPTPLDALIPRLVSLCRPGVVADEDASCGAAEALNLIVGAIIGAPLPFDGSGREQQQHLDLALPGSPPPSPLAPSVAAALPRLAAALFDLLSDASCARGRRAGAAGLVQLVVLAPGTLAVGPAAAALVAAFVLATGDPDDAVALEAAELWPALADVAPDSPPLRDSLPSLLPLLLRNMVYTADDDEVAEAEAAEADALALQRQQQRAASNGEASCSFGSSHGHSLSAYAAHDPTRDSELAPFISKGRRGVGENGGGEAENDAAANDDVSPGAASATSWNLRKASAAALDVLATTFGDDLLPLVTPSIREGLAAVETAEQDEERLRRRRAARRSKKRKSKSDRSEKPKGDSPPLLPSTLDEESDESDDGGDDGAASGLAWRRREASVLALGAIAEGCGPALAPHLPELASLLLPCLGHPRPLLRSIACWALSRYCRWLALAAGASAADAASSAAAGGSGGTGIVPPGEVAAASELLDAVLSGLASAAACDPNPRVQEAACSGLATLVEEMGASVAAGAAAGGEKPPPSRSDGRGHAGSSDNGLDDSAAAGPWQRGCQACDADRARALAAEAEASARGGFGASEAAASGPAVRPLAPLALLPPEQHLGGHRPPRLRVVSAALAAAARAYGRKPARMLYDAVATLADAAGPALGGEPCARAALMPALLERMRATPDGDRELLPLLECLTAAAAAMGPGFALSAGACLERAVSVLSAGIEARERALREASEAASRAFASAAAAAAAGSQSGNSNNAGDEEQMFNANGEDDDDGDLAAAAAAAASAAAAVLPPSSSSPPRSSPSLALSAANEASLVAAAVAAAASQGPERDFVVGALDLVSGIAEGLGPAVSRFFFLQLQDASSSSSSPLANGAAAAASLPPQPTRAGALLLPALLRAADDPDADVRQSAFALAGDLARSCPRLLAPAAADVVALATEGLSPSRAGTPDAVSAVNNAAWALGEVAVALPAAVAALAAAAAAAETGNPSASSSSSSSPGSFSSNTPYSFSAHLPPSRVLPTAAERLHALLRAPAGATPRSLLENAAISLGRLSLVAPTALARGADAPFVARWCSALRAVRDDVEKEHAFLGLAALLRASPAAGAPPAFASLCEAVTSWRLPLRSRALAEELASLMRAYRAGAGPHAWAAAVAGLSPGVREKLGAMCGV